jgi:hypothetical protein
VLAAGDAARGSSVPAVPAADGSGAGWDVARMPSAVIRSEGSMLPTDPTGRSRSASTEALSTGNDGTRPPVVPAEFTDAPPLYSHPVA